MDNKAKYEEALERARNLYPGVHSHNKAMLEQIFPQLREDEDENEIIRKWLVDYFTSIKSGVWHHRNTIITCEQILAWLEKQKDSIPYEKYVYDIAAINAEAKTKYHAGWNDGYEAKQEGQKHEECDFTIYHPLKNEKGEYECIPYSFYGSLTSFSEDKDLIDFLRTCFYTEEECNEWIEQQKEQKPRWEINNPHTTKWTKEMIDEKFEELVEQKPAEGKYYSSPDCGTTAGSTSDESEFDKGYRAGKAYQLKNVASSLRGYACGLTNEEHIKHIEKGLDWLENRLKSLRPSWKPSEEQLEEYNYWYRNFIKSGLSSPTSKAVLVLGELLEQLKKLKEE